MQNETQRSESRCAEETWFQRHLPQPGRVVRVQYLWKSHSAKLGPGNGRSLSCCSKGCGNSEIARDLHIAERTVKAHFNRLFLRFGIKSGIKRVKLATLLYRRQLWLERKQPVEGPAKANTSSSNAQARAARTRRSPIRSGTPSTW